MTSLQFLAKDTPTPTLAGFKVQKTFFVWWRWEEMMVWRFVGCRGSQSSKEFLKCALSNSRLSLRPIRRDLSRNVGGSRACDPFPARPFSQTVPAAEASTAALSPAVHYLVGTHNITDTSIIPASGPKNRLLKG